MHVYKMLRFFFSMFTGRATPLPSLRAWLPREGSRIQGFLARQADQTRGNNNEEGAN